MSVGLEVRNQAATASGAATWADRIPWEPGAAGPGILPVLAPGARGMSIPGASATLSYTLRPPQRGIYPIGPLEVEYMDPFHLAWGSASLGGTQSLSVIPAIVSLGEGGPSILAGDGSARVIQRRATGSDDDLMTREYRSGDALRRVHWRASARHGELMVRQEEQRTFPEARLLFDTRRDGYGDAWTDLGGLDGSTDAFEWAVTMIASIGVHLHRAGFRVDVVETGPRQLDPLGNVDQGAGQDIEFLVSLAAVHPSDPGYPLPERRTDAPPGPVFAVLANPGLATLDWIASQRRAADVGIAFIVGTRSARAHEALAAAGWICVPVHEGDDPALVWSGVSRAQVGRVAL